MEDTTLTSTQPNYQVSVQQAVNQQKVLVNYLRQGMIEGVDFGMIPGAKGKSLFKNGAVKICRLLKLRQRYELIESIVNFDEPALIYYHTKCYLLRGEDVIGEGSGSCSSRERKYQRQVAADISNTILKMAEKRALVGAVQNVCGVAEVFAGE